MPGLQIVQGIRREYMEHGVWHTVRYQEIHMPLEIGQKLFLLSIIC